MATNQTIATVGEFGLIQRLFVPLGAVAGMQPPLVGIGDDGAVTAVPRTQHLVTTTDTLVEGIHFNSDMDPLLLGRKSLAVNLSDLAAMGAAPQWYLLSLALPPSTPLIWAEQFAQGLRQAAEPFNVALIGGDTVGAKGGIVITITLLGLVGEDRAVKRSGAAAGDLIYVSGTIGDAALGLGQMLGRLPRLDADEAVFLEQRQQLPEPRVALGLLLQDTAVVRAAIDVSDGLVADLGHLCVASGVAARVDWERLPLSPAARRLVAARGEAVERLILTGGEDYELLFAVPSGARAGVEEVARRVGVPLTEIGEFQAGAPRVTVVKNGAPFDPGPGGWTHF
ncbi:MAG: thiamine-phosphate kinase [Magnetococcales bacterium]|nr:thiamine-phosphate kinase [Magnetococcales bacterium]